MLLTQKMYVEKVEEKEYKGNKFCSVKIKNEKDDKYYTVVNGSKDLLGKLEDNKEAMMTFNYRYYKNGGYKLRIKDVA